MKTRQVMSAVVGAVLLTGTMAYAQQNDPQGPGPRGDGPEGRPNAQMQPMQGGPACGGGACMRPEGMGRMQQRGPGFGGGAPMRIMERGPEGMGAPQMQQRGPGPEGSRGPMPDPEHAKQAGATDQQLEALKAFAFEQQTKRIDLQAAVDKAELALDHLMKSEAVDEKAAFKAADALTQARGELFKLGITDRVKVREILGADVLKKLHEMAPPRAQCPMSDAQGPCQVPQNQAPNQGAPGQGGNPPNPSAQGQGGVPPPQGQAK